MYDDACDELRITDLRYHRAWRRQGEVPRSAARVAAQRVAAPRA